MAPRLPFCLSFPPLVQRSKSFPAASRWRVRNNLPHTTNPVYTRMRFFSFFFNFFQKFPLSIKTFCLSEETPGSQAFFCERRRFFPCFLSFQETYVFFSPLMRKVRALLPRRSLQEFHPSLRLFNRLPVFFIGSFRFFLRKNQLSFISYFFTNKIFFLNKFCTNTSKNSLNQAQRRASSSV